MHGQYNRIACVFDAEHGFYHDVPRCSLHNVLTIMHDKGATPIVLYYEAVARAGASDVEHRRRHNRLWSAVYLSVLPHFGHGRP